VETSKVEVFLLPTCHVPFGSPSSTGLGFNFRLVFTAAELEVLRQTSRKIRVLGWPLI